LSGGAKSVIGERGRKGERKKGRTGGQTLGKKKGIKRMNPE